MKSSQSKFILPCLLAVGCAGADDERPMELGSVEFAQSSRDYPGPCTNEATSPDSAKFLSSDVATKPFDSAIINLPQTGRQRLGISCVNTLFKVIALGSGNTVFQHRCTKHGFGWYDATNLPAGAYRLTAESRSFIVANVLEGHGTMDSYGYFGNGGAFQPVNCAPPGAPDPPSAPKSASVLPQNGPAMSVPSSTTLTPASGPIF